MPEPNDFNAYVPIDFFEKGDEWRFGGFVSTEHRDQEGEILLQEGLVFDPFVQRGYFNDNHDTKTGEGAVIGVPISLEKRTTPDGKRGTWVEGKLLKGVDRAKTIWQTGQALKTQTSGATKRQLGFSLQGKITHRTGARTVPKPQADGSIKYVGDTVTRALVKQIAITHCPVNPYAGMELLCKSLMAGSAIESPGAVPGNAFALRTESLDGQQRKRRRTRSEAIEMLMQKGLSKAGAELCFDLATVAPNR